MNHKPNSRPTRSRRSSPLVSSRNNASSSTRSAADSAPPRRTFLDKWTEPALATMPSFQEAGMERHGVVANMQTLGTRPSAKIVKSAGKPEDVDGGRSRRTALGKEPETSDPSLSVTPKEAVMTPEPIPEPVRRRSSSTKTNDLDYIPPSTPQQQTSTRQSLPRSSVALQSGGNRSESRGMFTGASSQQHTPILQQSPSSTYPRAMNTYNGNGWDGRQIHVQTQTRNDKMVEYAVQLAVEQEKYPTAYALRTLYDEDPMGFGAIIAGVLRETATQDMYDEFYRDVAERKKIGRKGKTAEYYFIGDGSDLQLYRPRHIAPLPPVPTLPPAFKPFIGVFEAKTTTYQTPYAAPPPPAANKVTESSGSGINGRSSINQSSVPASPHEEPDHSHHPNKKHKSSNFPVTDGEFNATAVLEDMMKRQREEAASASYPTAVTSSPLPEISDRPRAGSVSSSSSLSSVNSQILEDDTYDSPINVDHAPINAGTTKPSDGFVKSKGQGIVGAKANANANLGASVATETKTQSNAGGSVKKSRPIRNEDLSGSEEQYNLLPIEKNANNKISATINTKTNQTSSPIPSSFPTIRISNNVNNAARNIKLTTTSTSSRNSQPLTDNDNLQTRPEMAPELVRTSSSSSSSVIESIPVLKQPTGRKSTIIFKSKKKEPAPPHPTYEEGEVISQLKRKAREITNGTLASESFERNIPRTITPVRGSDSASDEDNSIAVTTFSATTSGRPAKVRLINKNERTTRRATTTNTINYDSELSSPTVLSFQPDLGAPGSIPSSRAGTPNTLNRPTRKAKTGTGGGVRVKTSPMKKKSGPSAGIPKASGERDSPLEKDTKQTAENDEYCAACGGNGQLVCCDGCTRSFHFKCIDPPLEQSALPEEEEWFCTSCLARNAPRSKEDAIGTFGPLLANLERKNPSAFHLPKAIREYFDNVKTGTEGEYEEGVVPKPKNNRAGYDETPDYFRLKDNRGNTILCHACHQAARTPDKAIIPCSYCSLSWHLDCLDVPLAKEPPPGRTWRCPAHVDDLLSLAGGLGPAHKFRKIKGASAIKPTVSRGVKNNGYIEIENDPSDNEDEVSGFFEQKEYGRVYKLPEEGIKLDFISRIHREFGTYSQRNMAKKLRVQSPPIQPEASQPSNVNVHAHSLDEQQAALNLAYLANSNQEISVTQSLIDALITEAPESVIKLIAQGSASKLGGKALSNEDKTSLVAMRSLLDNMITAAGVKDTDMVNGQVESVDGDS